MLISRHVFRRISRCPFGIVQMCFSLFLWLYQYILRPNNQKKPGPVEHHCFEGKSHNFVYVTNRFKLKQLSQVIDLKNSTINLHFLRFPLKSCQQLDYHAQFFPFFLNYSKHYDPVIHTGYMGKIIATVSDSSVV